MMKRLFAGLILLMCCALQNNAATSYEALWDKSIKLYDQKQYDSAAYYLEQLAALTPRNAEIYYNLGNTYYRLNKIAPAVLNYARALRYKPDFQDARDNLSLTEDRISNHIQGSGNVFFVTWWHILTRSSYATNWAILSLLVFIGLLAILLVKRKHKNNIWLRPQVIGFLCVVWMILMVISFSSAYNATHSRGAVVMIGNAPLMNMDLKGNPQSLIPEGTIVIVTMEKEGWYAVRLPDGRKGWMQQAMLTKI